VFLTRPLSGVLMVASALALALPLVRDRLQRRALVPAPAVGPEVPARP
jgi:hypothetical protein